MINNLTVLILGAGASAHLGFPTGNILKRMILQFLVEGTPQFSYLSELGFNKGEILEFRDTYRQSGKSSVDAFLEHRTELINVGKAAIAAALIPSENMDSLFGSYRNDLDLDWYEYLYGKLNCPFEDFDRNKLGIITYNYDRSFEHYLFTALKNSYSKSDAEVAEKLSNIPVIHLHGRLGYLPWQRKFSHQQSLRDYVPNLAPEAIRVSADKIRIIHEDIARDPEFRHAREVIGAAKQVIFLGFGYDATNIQRLDIDFPNIAALVSGSCYGFTHLEIQTLRAKFHSNIRLMDRKVLDFLREMVTLQ